MRYKLSDVIAVARQEIFDEYASKGYHFKLGNGDGAIWLELSPAEYRTKLFFAARAGIPRDEIILQLVYPKSLGSKDTPQAAAWYEHPWLKQFNYTKDKYLSIEDRIEASGSHKPLMSESELKGLTESSVEIAKRMLDFYISVAKITADAI
jgi:hypothetical protein